MPDYSLGKIYKITNDENESYYGSTTQKLTYRFSNHKSSIRGNKYSAGAKIVLEGTNPKIELVENFSCKTRNELLLRESWYIKNNKCVNIHLPLYDKEDTEKAKKKRKEYMKSYCKEWYKNNKKRMVEKSATYYEKNKNVINSKGKETVICECGAVIAKSSLRNHLKSKRHLDKIN